ncbi:lipase [Nocardia sp. 852002-20019_SCH5090214]|jgi:triacylglycerol esterase/lipase EstA (alpha/beta hydrolase family)|uniref:Lipase n=1 Tax=Nocardia nova TaxID=37330 RepID=A0A2S5ZVQ5_9NOCA|nr:MULTISPECIES: alpha/beta fold hydrolase [Nocardia]OBF74237.1 lipase [Mycobacterium sp. 852002-51759_SCH5129042]MBF6277208.1 alpha/beta fold hydrolase [Nocardia nova]MBV7707913.1 alpha/beta fold hydrolase [Nocardia nova]OBA42951.1 lipase [Nocardia sp. 852002-51101_SCH5132738]OBA53421.1 lipase [Nocardia sp. 852002-20019_SCH5090214]
MKLRHRIPALAALICAAVIGSGTATAAPPDTPETQLADLIAAGLHPAADGDVPQPILDTGSSSGSGGRVGSHASEAVGEGPEMTSYLAAFGYGLTHPDAAPPGANRWDCVPSADHPKPIVLVHGTWLNAYDSFAYMAPKLARAGFCIFAFNYGRSGLLDGGGLGAVLPGRYAVGPIEDSAWQLAAFVDRVRATTHSDRVDIVAHSQGAPVADQYLKFDGGAEKVGQLVSFGGTHHGTTLLGMATLGRIITNLGIDILGFYRPLVGPANIQQAVGSPFLNQLNLAGDTVPGVAYTVVASRYDEVMNPVELALLRAGPDATVDDITLQDGCEQDLSDHLTMMYSPRALSIALHALDPQRYPTLSCSFNPWLVGGGGGL